MLKVAREPWVDAMRALALLGVFLINGLGYAFSPNYPLQVGPPQPIDSFWASAALGIVIALVQGKAWSLLSFLFGYSLCAMSLGNRKLNKNNLTALQRRYLKLFLLGVFHGVFLYFGDILTTYGLCGLLASKWVLARPAHLIKIWKYLSWLVGMIAFLVMGAVVYSNFFDASTLAPTLEIATLERVSHRITFTNFLKLNSISFVWQQLDSIFFFLPLVLWCCVTGILARRFNLLSINRRSKEFWQRNIRSSSCLVILILNIALGLASMVIHQTDGYSNRVWFISAFSSFLGMALSAAFIATSMRYLHSRNRMPAWMVWLAPAGRHTLAMYLALSTLLVLSNGSFLHLQAGTMTTLFFLVLAWLIAVLVAKEATRREIKDPIARWLSS
jgi:uncharacterized protein